MRTKARKLMWSVPLVATLAIIGALALFVTLAPNEASAQPASGNELPGAVQNLQVTAFDDGVPEEQLEVTWEGPDPTMGGFVDSYRIDISTDGLRWMSHVPNHRDSELRLVYTGLQSEQTRHFRVFAVNRDGTGPGTDASGATDVSVTPDRPEDLLATAAAAGATIALDLNGDGDATDTAVDNVDETKFGIDLNGDGDALDTDVDGVDETAIAANPQTVITLAWDAPDDAPPGAPITGYKIQYAASGNAPWHDLADGVRATSYAHVNLLAGTTRYYRVYAENKYGLSGVSDEDSAVTGAGIRPSIVPIVPLPVIGLSPRGYDVHLTWTAPADPAGDPITHYIVQARVGTSSDDDDYENVHSGASIDRTITYNFGGRDIDDKGGIDLPALNAIPAGGVEVDIRIGAVNNANRDAEPTWLVLADVPIGHEGVPEKPDAPSVRQDQTQNQGRSGLNVVWETAEFIDAGRPGDTDFGTFVSYILVVDDTPATAVTQTHTAALLLGGDFTKPGFDDDSLETETGKTYYVYALNSAVTVTDASVRSFPSRTGENETAGPLEPDAPTDLDVQDSGHTEIDLTWSHASIGDTAGTCTSDDDGSECGESVITGYKIEMSETGDSGWATLEDNREPLAYTADELRPDQRYYFRISAINSRYTSDPTPAESVKTTDPGAPTPPGGLVAQAEGRNAVKLCWYEQNVVDSGGAQDEKLPVLGYKITRQAAGGQVMTVVENTGNDETQYSDTGLMAGTMYTYQVHSITLGGTSEGATATVSTVTAMVPSMPTGVMATSDAAGMVTVDWMPGADAMSQVVIVVNAADDTDYCLGIVAGDASSHTCPEALTSGATYVVLVIALDDEGGYKLGNIATYTAS